MTRKRAKKWLMSMGFTRDTAELLLKVNPYPHITTVILAYDVIDSLKKEPFFETAEKEDGNYRIIFHFAGRSKNQTIILQTKGE